MKTLPSPPEIWNDDIFDTTRTAVIGELACWAIRQCGQLQPIDLATALAEFDDTLEEAIRPLQFQTSYTLLERRIIRTFELCPTIMGWRHRGPDFIDIRALAQNVAQGVTLREKYSLA